MYVGGGRRAGAGMGQTLPFPSIWEAGVPAGSLHSEGQVSVRLCRSVCSQLAPFPWYCVFYHHPLRKGCLEMRELSFKSVFLDHWDTTHMVWFSFP